MMRGAAREEHMFVEVRRDARDFEYVSGSQPTDTS